MRPTGELGQLAAALGHAYGLGKISVRQIPLGFGTTNFCAETPAGRLFVKAYASTGDLDLAQASLVHGEVARRHGVPVPDIVRDRDGALVADIGLNGELAAVSVHRWVEGSAREILDAHSSRVAGKMLGRIHRGFAGEPRGDDAPAAMSRRRVPGTEEMREHFSALRAECASRADDPIARLSIPLLERRLELIEVSGHLFERLAELPVQLTHGDFCTGNFLFDDDGSIVAVFDFGPPVGAFPDRELARLAFNPDAVTTDPHWCDSALAAFSGYVSFDPAALARKSLVLAPSVWLCGLISSDYGLREHLYHPHPLNQLRADRYWTRRCATIELLLENLDDLERSIGALVA